MKGGLQRRSNVMSDLENRMRQPPLEMDNEGIGDQGYQMG